jgi:hypothetical protein
MGLTRRSFLGRAGIGLAALAATANARTLAALAQGQPGGAAGRIIQRAVALGPGGVGDSQLYSTNRRFFDQTSTPWVRLWADWPTLQPERNLPPDAGTGASALARLDEGIDGARRDGRRIILTAWRFPRWANGTDTIDPVRDLGFELQDRLAIGSDPAHRKDLTFRLPDDLSPGSDWANWIDFLLTRYGQRIDALELTNEPNLQLWPQRDIAGAVARMFVSAQAVASRHLGAPLLVGPATADPVGDSRLRTGYDTFTRDLLDELDRRAFVPGPSFAWSHHTYADLEGDLEGPANRAAAVHSMLAGRWVGWPTADPVSPGILITETGARLDRIATQYGLPTNDAARQKQAELIDRYWHRTQFGPEGAGVGMVCQYLFVTDANYDVGLCDLDGAPRPAFHSWARLPAFT